MPSPVVEFQHEIDARNESCPSPVIKAKDVLLKMSQGEVLHLICTDPTSRQDIKTLLDVLDDELLSSSQTNGEYHFYIKKN